MLDMLDSFIFQLFPGYPPGRIKCRRGIKKRKKTGPRCSTLQRQDWAKNVLKTIRVGYRDIGVVGTVGRENAKN